MKKVRILVAEDNNTDLFLIREAVKVAQLDAELEVVRDGEAATEYFDRINENAELSYPDLILLDLNLPKRTGEEVLRDLRARPGGANIKVLIVSSSNAPKDSAMANFYAANAYFQKPSSYREFMKLGNLVHDLLKGEQN